MRCTVEPGSFRDRNGRIYYIGDQVYRGLSGKALEDWEELAASRFYARFAAEGKIIGTERVDSGAVKLPAETESRPWQAVLVHDRVPFVSYPYEWTFSMLKDGALLQLELMEAALAEDMILKDASSYNIQWRGCRPQFIDIPSFERLGEGEPWVGYRQFCQLFLYPLQLQAYRGVSFRPYLRGSLDGIPPGEMAGLMGMRDWFRKGVFTHVFLQSKLQGRQGDTTRHVKSELKHAGFSRELIVSNVRRMRRTVAALDSKIVKSEWSEYGSMHNYSETDHQRKAEFVEQVASSRQWGLVWDLGCNTGLFSSIAARFSRYVVAMDADALAVEHLYKKLGSDGGAKILPLVMNLADASPDQGWRGRERKSLTARATPDLTLCLALLHHLVISANIPLQEIVAWLASLDSALVIEFVDRKDEMVKTLLRNKEDHYTDYDLQFFKACLAEHFALCQELVLSDGARTLFFAEPKRT